jgi:hypothetical protein
MGLVLKMESMPKNTRLTSLLADIDDTRHHSQMHKILDYLSSTSD